MGQVKNNYLKLLLYSILAIFSIAVFFVYYHSYNGDASIYFVYYKNFFSLPFSFQKLTVGFGATSPMQVIIFSFIFHIFNFEWMFFLKLFNYLFVITGIIYLYRAINGDIKTLLLFSLLTFSCIPLLSSILNVFEVGLVILSISVIYYYYKKENFLIVILLSGLLHLIRPELILLSIVFDYYSFRKYKSQEKIYVLICSFFPIIIYYLYMFINTASIMPSNIYNRLLLSRNYDNIWFSFFVLTMQDLFNEPHKYLLFITGFICIAAVIYQKRFEYKLEIICSLVIFFLCIIAPQGLYAKRYLLSSLPFLFVIINEAASQFLDTKKMIIVCLSLITLILSFYSYSYVRQKKYIDTSDKILLKDLADKLNPLLNEDDKILIYEIQSQFYIKGYCLSLDGLIGSQLEDVVKRNTTYSDFIKTNKIKYVVTNGDFFKKDFSKNTLLEKLYNHDLYSNIGDTITIDNIKFKKILVNDYYSNEGSLIRSNTGIISRNYNNEWILWDSVYLVE